jgi:TrpR-related protein YerC/YecD
MTSTAEGSHEWRTPQIADLFKTIVSLKTEEEAARFFRDLCTISELEAMSHRWHAARLVDEGRPYLEVAKATGASTATVTRVAHWLKYGDGGYRSALDRRKRRPSKTA